MGSAEVAGGLVDEVAAEWRGPAVVAARGLVLEYGQELPEDDRGGYEFGDGQAEEQGAAVEYGRVDAVGKEQGGIDLDEGGDCPAEFMGGEFTRIWRSRASAGNAAAQSPGCQAVGGNHCRTDAD